MFLRAATTSTSSWRPLKRSTVGAEDKECVATLCVHDTLHPTRCERHFTQCKDATQGVGVASQCFSLFFRLGRPEKGQFLGGRSFQRLPAVIAAS